MNKTIQRHSSFGRRPTACALAFGICAVLLSAPQQLAAKPASQPETMDWIPVMAAICEATNAPVNVKNLGALVKVANGLPPKDAKVQMEIYRVVCAGLASIGDKQILSKMLPRIKGNTEGLFFIEPCHECRGTGSVERKCPDCVGSGRCPTCKGEGTRRRPGLQGAGDIVLRCPKCAQSGDCPRCLGRGRVPDKCPKCGGNRLSINWGVAERDFQRLSGDLLDSLESRVMRAKGLVRFHRQWVTPEEKERLENEEKGLVEYEGEWITRREREEREMTAKGLVRYRGEWVTKEERDRRVAKAREFAESMRDKGLVNIDGEWMTPESLRNAAFEIFQIYEPGHALCRFLGTDVVFCLLFSARDNRNVAEGDRFQQDLYRCGTYSYVTVRGAPSTVRMYAIDLAVALSEIKGQQ